MTEAQEKLRKEVGQLYAFVNIMYSDAMNSICKRKSKKTKGFEEERLLEYVQKEIKKSTQSYFKDFKIDEKLFDNFDEKQKKHLVNLSKNIDAVKESTAEEIFEEFFTPIAAKKDLENTVEKILSLKENSIESINRQIGYSMILYCYENWMNRILKLMKMVMKNFGHLFSK